MTERKPTAPLLPATRAVRRLRELGWVADYAERRMGKISKDWAGFADIIAVSPFGTVMFLQVTSSAHLPDRLRKVMACEEARKMMQHHIVAVWGYKRGRHLQPDREEYLTSDATAHAEVSISGTSDA